MTDSIRIFQLAKELNISHNDIVDFLKSKGISVSSHMSPIDGKTQQVVYTEFAKDRQSAERDRKEQVRKEIHDSKVVMETKSVKKFTILSVQDQREQEKIKEVEAKKVEGKKTTKVKSEKVVEKKEPKKKLRKITLREPSTPQDKKDIKKDKEAIKKDTSAVKRLKKTLASMDASPKKKSYKKAKKDSDSDLSDTPRVVELAEYASIDEIAKVLDVSTSEVIGKCLQMGVLATVNQRLGWDVIELIAGEYNVELKKHEEVVDDLFVIAHTEEELVDATNRAPVVTIMGHVDHGKTSILDYIRETKVAADESGGITQRVGAYQVDHNGNKITFLDTPGHEAFTAMRARGAQSTDIVILVVAADDSVMPQTLEAINHSKAAEVPIIVAINKIDKPGANPDTVKRELSEKDVLVEDWGGKIQSVHTSAITGEGIDALMEAILLEAEVLDLKANATIECKGTVIDSKLDKGLGAIATVLIQKGTLKIGTLFICNNYPGKVRAIMNERGERIKTAEPSDAVQILGFDQVPQSGDIFAEVSNESDLKKIANKRQRIKREIDLQIVQKTSLDSISAQIKEGDVNNLNVIIKADSDGSIEALIQSLEKINNDEVGVYVVHKGIGNVSDSDVLLAQASKAVVIGFGVQVPSNTKLLANQSNVEIRAYNIIYQVVEDVKLAVEGLLRPDLVEEVLGEAIVKESFKIPKIGFIAGSQVESGKITRDCFVRLIREDEELISKGKLVSLKRFKDDVNSVDSGLECGIAVEGVKKYFPGDRIVAYKINEIKRKLS
ncbi:MAG TPA: translation initiation factor IF-2 [Candidatus Marinimicrobia bacterium]|jgi:translation initiation factor IF-2|nr:translation initiation factor IF-2 [Candidatus Neomarinimicrobiota bacterium]HIL86010.1 translation initiation factor IF-2 [Candidatus Neomarinimicrobiota bacterium]